MFEPFDFSDAVNNPRIWEQVRSTLLEQADKSLTLAPGVNGVYIARSGLRSVKNEASLVPLFERHKIVAMRAEALSIRQQVRIASLSRILVGPHGSGITNSLFMPRESAVVELLPALMLNACFYHIAKILNHRYYTVPTTPTDHDPDKERVEPSLIYLELILEQELSR
jgi:capsular polysaccharide biosynthesis protein